MPYSKPVVTPEWMKVSEAAARLDCHPKTVLNRIRAGTIPVRVLRIERITRLNRSDFEAYLQSLTEQLPEQPCREERAASPSPPTSQRGGK